MTGAADFLATALLAIAGASVLVLGAVLVLLGLAHLVRAAQERRARAYRRDEEGGE